MHTPVEFHDRDTTLALNLAELQEINGGYVPSIVDVSAMPDRSVICGTMWYLDRLLKRSTGTR